MAAYAVVLMLLGATYASLIFAGPGIALAFALIALAVMLLTLALVIFK